jgi:hypothetical protein
MPININKYVDITSGVAGANTVAVRQLIGLRFTTDPRVPVDAVVTMAPDDAVTFFGAGTPEAAFAAQYGAYVSPAPASKAKLISFGAFAATARPPRIYGSPRTANLAALKLITAGSLTLTIGAVTQAVSPLNFAAATSFSDVATTLQTAIRAASVNTQWATSTVTYDSLASRFIITGAVAEPAAIGAANGTTADALGLTQADSIDSPGSALQTPLAATQVVASATDNFGSFSFGSTLTLDDVVAIATWNAAQNIKFQFYFTPPTGSEQTWYAALVNIASCAMIINRTAGEYKEALPAAIMAAIDYTSGRNVNVNFMYRQGPFTADIGDTAEAATLSAIRANYYGVTQTGGQLFSFFQDGLLMGGATAATEMNVHANEQWLKSDMQSSLLNLQLSIGGLSANNAGSGRVRATLISRITAAIANGVISPGKTLTTDQQIAVTDISGDVSAWRDVQSQGYWLGVAIVPRVESGTTKYVAVYTLAYAKNDVVRKIEGSHNLI